MKFIQLRQSIALLLLLFLPFASQLSAQPLAGSNVVLIVADDLGIDKIGLYGVPSTVALPNTPTIDNLAAHGVLFENAWAQPVCSPTRATLLTGTQPYDHGVGSPVGPPTANTLPSSANTLAEVLRARGYFSGMFGKWHLGTAVGERPWEQGWDYFSGSLDGSIDYYDNWERTVYNGVETTTTTTDYATKDAVDSAVTWIRAQKDTTWFASVTFNAPHDPFHWPLATCDGVSGLTVLNDTLNYNRMVNCMDYHMGRLVDSLAAIDSAMAENTVIIFVGDNGTPNEVSEIYDGKAKVSVYLGGVQVPLIIADGASLIGRTPRFYKPDTTEDAFAHVVDLFATIGGAGIGGGNVSTGYASHSLTRYLTNPALATDRNHNFSQQFTDGANPSEHASYIKGDYKLNIHMNSSTGDTCYELFDIDANPEENCNLLDTPLVSNAYFFLARNMINLMNANYQAWNQGTPGNFPSLGVIGNIKTCHNTLLYPPDAAFCGVPKRQVLPTNDWSAFEFILYPNPTSGDAVNAQLGLTQQGTAEVELLDMMGRVVTRAQPKLLSKGEHTIWLDLTGVAAGTYVCTLKLDGLQHLGKVLVVD